MKYKLAGLASTALLLMAPISGAVSVWANPTQPNPTQPNPTQPNPTPNLGTMIPRSRV